MPNHHAHVAHSLLPLVAMRLALTGLIALGAVYLTLAWPRLIADIPGSYPIDLRLRWIEHRQLADGQNPQTQGHPGLPDSHATMRTQGGGYPPWAYAMGSLFVPPISFTGARWYYAIVCAAALALLAAWGVRMAGWVGLGGVLATFPAAICISYGQYGVVIAALLAGALWLLERGRSIAAGIMMGLAMVKPNLAVLFLLTALLYRDYRAVACAVSVVGIATLSASWMANTSPLVMLSSFGNETGQYYWLSHNPLLPWLTQAIGFGPAVAMLGLGGLAVVVAIFALTHHRLPLADAFAIAAFVTMFWSYRRHYDTVLLVLLLVPMLREAPARGWRTKTLTLVLGLTLWLPIRHTQWDLLVVKVVDLVVWSVAIATLVVLRYRQRSDQARAASRMGPVLQRS
jgi:hypothetical protein